MGTSTIRWMVLCVIGLAGCTANQQSVYRHRTLNSEPSVSAGVLITDGREQSDYYWVHDITRDDGTVHRDADICRGSPASVFAMTGKTVTGNTGVSKGSVGLGLDQNYGYGLTESGGQLEKSQFQQSQDGFYQSIYPLYVTGRISLDRYYQLLLIQARTFIAEYGIQQIRDVGLTSRRLPFASSSAPNLQDNIGKIDTAQKRVDASKKAADSAASTLKSALGDKTQCSELETGKQADCAKAKAAADAAAGTLKADQAQLSALQDATKALVQSAASGATQQSSDTEPGIAMSDPSAKLAIAAIKDITEKAMQFDVTSILCLMSKTQLTEEQRRACVDPTNTSPIAPNFQPTADRGLLSALATAKNAHNRLYIQVGTEAQREPAEALRKDLMLALGNVLAVGHVEVRDTPSALQIRYYGADEIAGAKELASLLSAAFPGQNIALSDFSHGVVKQPEPGLYELWVPAGVIIGNAVRRH